MGELRSQQEFDAALDALNGGLPDGEQYQRLTQFVLDHPKARALADLPDPFSPEYRAAALDLYATLRARDGDTGYVAERDEACESDGVVPANLWTGLVPWSFRKPALVAEFLLSWAHILQLLDVEPGQSVLEYGPGSGQLLLFLARLGVQAYGVDIDATALEGIRRQGAALGLPVALERARFGEGFADQRFDAILFFEAFHHAADFPALLARLRERLKPGGRLVLCGEPVVDGPAPEIPFPWGPRLDALSVYCIRRWGWMELGFTRSFLIEAARRAGWRTTHHAFPGCSRANAFVLEPADPGELALEAFASADPAPTKEAESPPPAAPRGEADPALVAALAQTQRELDAMRSSTSWRLTAPVRAVGRLKSRWFGAVAREPGTTDDGHVS